MNDSTNIRNHEVGELTADLVEILSKTPFCRPAIAELAEQLSSLSEESASTWVSELTVAGEDVALDCLLSVCAYLRLRINASVLAQSMGVVADLSHAPYSFTCQGADAIEPLLEAARSEQLMMERQVTLARIATELTLRFDADPDRVERLLMRFCEHIAIPPLSLLVNDTIAMLISGTLEPQLFPIMIDFDIHEELPERPQRKVIGGGGTVRRPIPKISRNAPCHCGSGKKYKQCCFEKDREILADASEYEGITQTQLHENPAIVDDPHQIDRLRAYELKKLSPKALSPPQLQTAYYRACDFSLFELAFEMLLERSRREATKPLFDPNHFIDLMHHALGGGNMEVAQRARELVPADAEGINWTDIDMQFKLNQDPGILETVEARCREALNPPEDLEPMFRHGFCDLTHVFNRQFPALSICFARAALLEHPHRWCDNELLVEIVHQARIEIGLDPWDDPVDTLFYDAEDTHNEKREDTVREAQEAQLREELTSAREQARKTHTKLSEAETALKALHQELESNAKQFESSDTQPHPSSDIILADASEKSERLRRQVENLKAEVGNQQEARKRLREQLEKERQRAHRIASQEHDKHHDEDGTTPDMPTEKARPILLPEYADSFRNACSCLPNSTGASALKAVAGFAAYDSSVWRHTRSIKQLTNIYRVRIGIHYRLLLRWIPSQSLTVLDLIPRQDLETWIKRHL